jgi:hypothetical protein
MQLGRIEAKKATVVLEALLAGGDDTGVNVALDGGDQVADRFVGPGDDDVIVGFGERIEDQLTLSLSLLTAAPAADARARMRCAAKLGSRPIACSQLTRPNSTSVKPSAGACRGEWPADLAQRGGGSIRWQLPRRKTPPPRPQQRCENPAGRAPRR